jgi:hypothetical protein
MYVVTITTVIMYVVTITTVIMYVVTIATVIMYVVTITTVIMYVVTITTVIMYVEIFKIGVIAFISDVKMCLMINNFQYQSHFLRTRDTH